MKKTIMRDFLKIMKTMDMFQDDNWNKTESIYTFPRGGYIEFVGLDKADVGKGMRRDIVYFNEANKGGITFDAFMQVQSRSAITYLDYNPDRKFWAHQELIGTSETDFLILTYLDNNYLPRGEKKAILRYREKGFHDITGDCTGKDQTNIKSGYWSNKWIVYGLGHVGSMEGVIYTDWAVIEELPREAKYICTGLDFGFTNDPSAAVDIYRYDGEIILDQVLFRKGMTNRDIAKNLKGRVREVFADSAEPKSIHEIKGYGINIRGAKKGRDSVSFGIDLLQQNTQRPTRRSYDIINALENYQYDIDRDGNFTNKPHHDYSDIMDAVRYGAVSRLTNNTGTYVQA
jgi:phage terminase large subunit